jgi:putative component of toxin-antitoxin plasmid stabilization module
VKREISFNKNYFLDFYLKQNEKVQEKFDFVMTVIRTVDRVPEKFLKIMTGTDGIYEMRVEYGGNIYRTFCFFDEGQLVILLLN